MGDLQFKNIMNMPVILLNIITAKLRNGCFLTKAFKEIKFKDFTDRVECVFKNKKLTKKNFYNTFLLSPKIRKCGKRERLSLQ